MENNLISIISRFKGKKIAVIGDIMLDVYIFGNVNRLSQEAPIQIVDVKSEVYKPGGAANVAANLAMLGAKAFLYGVVGNDEEKNILFNELKQREITNKIIVDKNRLTIKKTRIISKNQQLLRIDKEKKDKIDNIAEKKILDSFSEIIKEVNAVVISDYNRGVITANISKNLILLCKKYNKPLIVDPKPANISLYNGAYLIKPNLKDIAELIHVNPKTEEELENIGRSMVNDLNSNILITKGEMGMSLFEKNGKIIHIPTEAKEVFDVIGAGDTVTSAMALAIAAQATLYEATIIANHAAGIVIGKFGTATVTRNELINVFEKSGGKIKEISELKNIVNELKSRGKKIVWTNGCFDILHAGHTQYLKEAKKLGDILVLGLNTDNSIRRIKGKDRPIISEKERAEMLSALECVDYILFFEEDTPIKQISALLPDVIAKGGDYKRGDVVGKDVVEGYGGEIVIIPLKGNLSTSKIINDIIQRHSNSKE